ISGHASDAEGHNKEGRGFRDGRCCRPALNGEIKPNERVAVIRESSDLQEKVVAGKRHVRGVYPECRDRRIAVYARNARQGSGTKGKLVAVEESRSEEPGSGAR